MLDMKARHESDINDLNTQITTFQNDLDAQITAFQNLEINNHKYVKQMVKGLEEYYVAGVNRGTAEAYYSEASDSYSNELFLLGNIYAGYADIYYIYANQPYHNAKAFFNTALDYTTSNNTRQLAQLFVNLSELDIQISNEMHEANEYFASACNYYYNNNYDMGGGEIDKMNEHITIHDGLIPTENDLWSEIDALLENFY